MVGPFSDVKGDHNFLKHPYGFRPDLISDTNITPNQNATVELSYPQGHGGSNMAHGIHGGLAHGTIHPVPEFGGHNRPPFGGHHVPPFGGHHTPPFGGHHTPPFGGHHRPPSNPSAPPHHNVPSNSQNSYYWQHWSVGQPAPHNAVRGGTDCDGTAIFVGRGFHNGDQIPAKVIPDKNAIYVAWGGDEIFLHSCELLCQQQFSWVHGSNGEVPYGAILAGHTADGEPLYVARVYHEGSHCVGKLHPSHGSCYVPFGGKEHSHSHYEVLVLRD